MALRDLQNELNDLVQAMAKEAGTGGSGSDDPFRKELNQLTQVYTYSEKQLLDELLNIRQKFDAAGKRIKRGKEGSGQRKIYDAAQESTVFQASYDDDTGDLEGPDAEMLKQFAAEAYAALNTEYDRLQTRKGGTAKTKFRMMVQGTTTTVVARAKKGETTDVFAALRSGQSAVMSKLKKKFVNLFKRGAVSGSQLYNLGHRTAVAQRKFERIDNLISSFSDDIGVADQLLQGELAAFRIEHNIFADHQSLVHMRNGTLKSTMRIMADVESWYLNQKVKAPVEQKIGNQAGWKSKDAKDNKQSADTLLKRIHKILGDQIKKAGAKGEIKRERSDAFVKTFGEMIINVSGVKKLARTGVVTNNTKFDLITPKTKKRIKAKKTWKQTGKQQKIKNPNIVSGFGAFPPGRKNRGSTEDPNSAAPLMALLQAKLPETVAKNMGPPGLQNQTGRFASSVQVTDVTTTAKGFPSVGYTYQKNPYQVFEVGQGDPRWATTDRDPRKLIDASIREIAAQQAIGRFYTRRV
jgi:hypothetical protein|tara:strand:+ start:510 stop:2075 length:1566 start_codon:yes stop_codon:yes gene_type:complete